jgi:DNA polymerase-3 subunit epsilon
LRQIVLDTETTGLDPALGHRVIELAAVEIVNRRPTVNRFHRYLNPDRECELGALRVHGITDDFLRDKPRFQEIAADFLDFIHDAELIIHNAPFDVAFLDRELALINLTPVTQCCAKVTDTLAFARELHPGKKNTLDALCERYAIDNSTRLLHGALLDAELLADVYLAMTRGQESLAIGLDEGTDASDTIDLTAVLPLLIVVKASVEELEAHALQVAVIDQTSAGRCLWNRLEC